MSKPGVGFAVSMTVTLALITAATAATAGCGGLTLADDRDGGSGRFDAGFPPDDPPSVVLPPPTKPSPPNVIDDPDPPGDCPIAGTVNAAALPYKSPYVAAGSCTTADLTALSTYVDNGGTFPGWKTAVPIGCQGCIFGSDTETLWRPILENGGVLSGINVGGCIAVATGSDACGRAYQQWYECRPEACTGCPDGDSAALQKCMAAASKGPCKKAFDEVSAICGDVAVGDAETACDGTKYAFEGPIRAQCIGL